MVSFTLMFTALATAAAVIASPVIPAVSSDSNCDSSTEGPFKLYTKQQGERDARLVRLVYLRSDSNDNPITTMTVCRDCGVEPVYWTLRDRVLIPHLFNSVEGQVTVNRPINQGKINFVTGAESSVEKSRIYCAVRNFLAVYGDADDFSICTFAGGPGIASRRDVYFGRDHTARNCQPVRLIMRSARLLPDAPPVN